jgi:hypothetical protein
MSKPTEHKTVQARILAYAGGYRVDDYKPRGSREVERFQSTDGTDFHRFRIS